jgi:uncharacterized protein (TIGR02246 family)
VPSIASYIVEVNMDSSPAPTSDSDRFKIAAFRQAWLAAVKAGNADSIAEMLTDDVVVVHGNGRCVFGKEGVKADFSDAFKRFVVDQSVSPTEVIVGEKWAFEISEVESDLTPVQGGQAMHTHSRTVVVLSRQPDASWKVCRVLGLLD